MKKMVPPRRSNILCFHYFLASSGFASKIAQGAKLTDQGRVMIQSLKHCILVFIIVGCISAVPAAAFADLEDGSRRSVAELLSLPASTLGERPELESLLPEGLPPRLDSWANDPREYGDYSILAAPTLPQGRLAHQPPFIDFARTQLGAFAGVVDFSSNFKARANFVGGV
ncbi:MAG TPA: hypothetical protein VKU80_12755, partial [Planctomycetota bacterium]|nr:hypothetical protein [Planctomycetota bacterium]